MDQAGGIWLIVTLGQRDNALVLGVKGERRRGPVVDRRIALRGPALGLDPGPIRVIAPETLIDRLQNLGPSGITLFLEVQGALDLLPLEEIVRSFLADLGLNRQSIRLSRLARRPWVRRNGFQLPLRIAGLGSWDKEVDRITDSKWWARQARDNGGLFTGLPAEGESALDVLVTGGEDLGLARTVMGPSAAGSGSRLLVVTDTGQEGLMPYLMRRFPLRPGQSMLVVPEGSQWGGPPMDYLLDEITHDRSFDELAQTFSTPLKSAVLLTDPAATQALRISDAASALIDDAATFGRSIIRGAPEGLAGRVEGLAERIEDPALRTALRRASAYTDLNEVISDAVTRNISFFAESRGFAPLTEARAQLLAAREAAEQTRALFADVDLSDSAETLEAAQGRVVNIAIQRTVYRASADPMVRPWERLERRAPYRLLVDIGDWTPTSLVVGAANPIDTLLPELEHGGRHLLHVAIYSDDFRVEAPASAGEVAPSASSAAPSSEGRTPLLRRLELPRIGPSAPVEFVVTPLTDAATAEARISLYYDAAPEDEDEDEDAGPAQYRNHLLQSFLLTAQVGEADALYGDADSIVVRLDMSQTERFAKLDRLKPRFLSLTLNHGPGEGTHRLMLKRGPLASGANFPNALMQEVLTAMRALLAKLCWNEKKTGPRFSAQDQAGIMTPTFNAALIELVKAGRQIYEPVSLRLLDQASGLAMMRAVRDSADEVIQVMRLDLSYYFPWTLIYDFGKPEPGAPVCDGFLRKRGDQPITCAECLKDCYFPDKSKAYCAFGFWGTRHKIEQLIGGSAGRDPAARLAPIGDGAVHVAVGIANGTLGGLETELRASLGARPKAWVSVAGPNEDLMSRLRDAQTRPAILLVASHCDSPAGPLAPSPRIQLPGTNHWLEPSKVTDEVLNHDAWKAPQQPLVVLAACDSGAGDLEKLSDFVAAFLRTGASAVVATEAVIFERLAVKFATCFTPEMLDGQTLGAVMLNFRRTLMRQGDPLGFLFTAYGPADLATASPPETAATKSSIVEPA